MRIFSRYHAQQTGDDGSSEPCLSFATCKTFGGCKPTNSSGASGSSLSGVGSSSGDAAAAAAAVADHVESQGRQGERATPVLQLAGWALPHIAEDDGMLWRVMKGRAL